MAIVRHPRQNKIKKIAAVELLKPGRTGSTCRKKKHGWYKRNSKSWLFERGETGEHLDPCHGGCSVRQILVKNKKKRRNKFYWEDAIMRWGWYEWCPFSAFILFSLLYIFSCCCLVPLQLKFKVPRLLQRGGLDSARSLNYTFMIVVINISRTLTSVSIFQHSRGPVGLKEGRGRKILK